MPTIQLESILNYRYLAYGGGDHGEARTKTNMTKRYYNEYLENMEDMTMADRDNPPPNHETQAYDIRKVANQMIWIVDPRAHWR